MNPITVREVVTALRAPRTFWLAVVYVAILAAAVWFIWPGSEVFSLRAQASRSILLTIVMVQTLLVLLYAPGFTATSIVAEKEKNAYDLLFSTLLRPYQIALGKLLSALVLLLLFMSLSLPFFATCFFLGAVSLHETFLIYLLLVTTSLVTGLIGLCVSTLADSSHSAIVRTYSCLLVITAGPWIPHYLLSNLESWALYGHIIRAFSPLAAVVSLIAPGFDHASVASWKIFLGLSFAASLIMMIYLFVATARSAGRRRTTGKQLIDDPKELSQRRAKFPFYLVDPQRRRRSLSDWVNPIFIREFRGRAVGGGVWVMRAAYLCVFVSCGLMILVLGKWSGHDPNTVKAIAIFFQLGLIMLLAPALTSSAITEEHELSNFDNLRLSRIGPLALLRGKFETALLYVLLLALGSFPLWLVIAYMKLNSVPDMLLCGALMGSTVLLCLWIGLACSSFCRRSTPSVAAAYSIVFVIGVATLLPYLAPEKFSETLRKTVLALNPFVATIRLINPDPVNPVASLWQAHLAFSLGLCLVLALLCYTRLRVLYNPERGRS